MKFLLALTLLALAAASQAGDLAPLEAQKIQYLIHSIETLEGAHFIRNGTAYDAKAAADHLRLKLSKAGGRVKTAEDFIKYCASVSSVSGKPYQIRFADGHAETSEHFLRKKLSEFSESVAH